ncbi:MAG TPA: aldo/keto reductase [Gaiellaceae bacterium]
MIEERRLGPAVGLGTWRTFDDDVEAARRVVGAALDAGVRVFDSSPMYGGAEASLGTALAGRRGEATVATKIWATTVREGREQFARQLEWFGGRVDVEQVHNLVAWREHVEWLEDERSEGRVGLIGVTHYDPAAFGELGTALRTRRFEVVQVPYNPWERECEREVLPLAEELGVRVIAMRPLGGSGETGRRRVELSAADRGRLGVRSFAAALLGWALGDPRIDCVIPATSRAERAAANAGARPLDADGRALVEGLAR